MDLGIPAGIHPSVERAPESGEGEERTVTLAGWVVDAAGTPAGGATVYADLHNVSGSRSRDESHHGGQQVTAGEDGGFRFILPVSAERWRCSVTATREGDGPGGQRLGSDDERTQELTIRLTRPSFVAGRVLDGDGNAIADARVRVSFATDLNQEIALLPPAVVTPAVSTDAEGRFRIEPLPAHCRASLVAEHPGYVVRRQARPGVRAGTGDAEIVMARSGTISGRVIRGDGSPAIGVVVRCQDVAPNVQTDGAGAYCFRNLAGGHYALWAVAPEEEPDLASEPEGVLLEEGAEARCPDLRLVPLERAGEITGKITDDRGEPIPDVCLRSSRRVQLPGGWAFVDGPAGRTDSDGNYRLRLPPDNWRVSPESYPRGYLLDHGELLRQNYQGTSVAVGRTRRSDFTLYRALPVAGQVLDAAGEPAAGAIVRPGSSPGSGDRQTTDAGGRFTLTRLLPHRSTLVAVFSDDRTQGGALEVTPAKLAGPGGAPPLPLTIRLQPLPIVAGTVIDPRGAPIVDAIVHVEHVTEREDGGRSIAVLGATTTGARGEFGLTVLPALPHRLTVEAAGFALAEQFPLVIEAATAAAPLRFVLERADGSVEGVVIDEDEQPVRGARVSAMRLGAAGFYTTHDETGAGTQGRFRLRHLPPGEVDLQVSAPGFLAAQQRRVAVGAAGVRLTIASTRKRPTAAPPSLGAPAPDFMVPQWVNATPTVPGMGAVPILAALRGKVVLLQFSVAHNPAALASNTVLAALHAALREERREDIAIVAVYDDAAAPAEVAEYATAEGLPFPIGIVERTRGRGAVPDPFRSYAAYRLPSLFLVDRDGVLRACDPSLQALNRLLTRGRRLPARVARVDGALGPPLKGSLRYTLDPAGVPFLTTGQSMSVSEAPPAGVRLPAFVTHRPRFLTAQLGDGVENTFYFAVDESERGSGFDLLYADGRRAGDLTRDKPIRLTRGRHSRAFQPIPLRIEVDGRPVIYHAAIVDRTSRDVPAYALQSLGYFSGEARFGKRCYPVVLVDADGNGRFADTGRSFAETERGDLLLVDLYRDGAFPEHDILDPKLHFLARSVRVEGRYYDLSVRADGTQLLAAPSRSTLATLRSDYGKFTLILGSEESLLVLRGERGRAQVPVGDYRLLGWQIEQCDRDGSIWKARGMSTRSGADARLLCVSAETILAGLAAPLTAKLSVAHITDGELQFGLQLTAASGERIQNLTRDDQLVPAPHVVLRDARGEEIASLSFHYG